jgi:hypothetical protein
MGYRKEKAHFFSFWNSWVPKPPAAALQIA